MANPTRFPSGISTYKTNSVLNTFPSLPASNQSGASTYEFSPYLAGLFTVTSTTSTIGGGVWNAAGAALTSGYNGGIVSMAVTTGAGGKAAIAYNGNVSTSNPFAFIPGNQVWFNAQIALNSSLIGYYTTGAGALTAGDATAVVRIGLMDVADAGVTSTIANGVYFELPGTKNTVASAANLVIKNTGLTGATVTTTIKNICDLARPSGIFGDTSSFGGNPASVLTTAGSANKYTSVVVAQPGSGYAQAPLVRTTGASAAAPFAQLYAQQGSGSVYAPYIAHVGGTGYTTFTNEVNPWIDLSLYYNGKGVLFVGVNGRTVASIGIQNNISTVSGSAQILAAGATLDTLNGDTFYPTNASMTTSIAPVLPSPGTFDLIMPMSPLSPNIGYLLNTANTNIMFVDQIQVGAEYN